MNPMENILHTRKAKCPPLLFAWPKDVGTRCRGVFSVTHLRTWPRCHIPTKTLGVIQGEPTDRPGTDGWTDEG